MRRRNGFTIVELLVAMALIMFIMAILSTAFATATQTFRNLKAVGDLASKLRCLTTILQRDLGADHFDGRRHLSDPNFWLNGPPSQGYFRVWQGSIGTPEGADLQGIGSYISTNHMLAFTVKLRGNQMGDFFSAGENGGGQILGNAPYINNFGPPEARYQLPNTFNSQWADVAWFLQPQVDPTGVQDTTSGGVPQPLYTLYRSQRLAVPDNSLVSPHNSLVSPPVPIPAYGQNPCLQLSCWGDSTTKSLYFNSPTDLTVPTRRFGMYAGNPAGLLYAVYNPPMNYPPAVPLWPFPGTPNGQPGWYYPNMPTAMPPTYSQFSTPYYPTLAQQGANTVAPSLVNADVQTTDVISFDVRLLVQGVADVANPNDPFITLFDVLAPTSPINYNNGNPAFYNPSSPSTAMNPAVFDTWTSLNDGLSTFAGVNFGHNYTQWNVSGHDASMPLWNSTTNTGPTILAIQITIRLWDFKTQQTREVTIVQAM